MYEGYFSRLVVVQYLVMPHIRYVYKLLPIVRAHIKHVYVLLPRVMPHVRHARLGLHIVVILNGRTTRIWSFGYGFTCATAIGCAGFRLFFGTITDLELLTIIK